MQVEVQMSLEISSTTSFLFMGQSPSSLPFLDRNSEFWNLSELRLPVNSFKEKIVLAQLQLLGPGLAGEAGSPLWYGQLPPELILANRE